METRSTDVLIVGGGLAGLAVADALETQGAAYHLVEARNRLGGRMQNFVHGGAEYDLGPAWFWPGQPRIEALITRFALQVFEQYWQGEQLFEDAQGGVHHATGFASMRGSYRIAGGMTEMSKALARGVPKDRISLNAQVTTFCMGQGITATLANGDTIQANKVVLALPPRLAAQLVFDPALPDSALAAMHAVPTWMAGHAKALAVYDTPFWRDAGLSGDASSRRGPLVEIHDASPLIGGPYALFGFLGVTPQSRRDNNALEAEITKQLTNLIGPNAAAPQKLILKDWASDPFTASIHDLDPLYTHPDYGMPSVLSGLWDNRLHFAGTEVAQNFGGYLEGALEAGDACVSQLTI